MSQEQVQQKHVLVLFLSALLSLVLLAQPHFGHCFSGWDGVNHPTQTVLVTFSTLEGSPAHRVTRARGIAVVLYLLLFSGTAGRHIKTCPTINTSHLKNPSDISTTPMISVAFGGLFAIPVRSSANIVLPLS